MLLLLLLLHFPITICNTRCICGAFFVPMSACVWLRARQCFRFLHVIFFIESSNWFTLCGGCASCFTFCHFLFFFFFFFCFSLICSSALIYMPSLGEAPPFGPRGPIAVSWIIVSSLDRTLKSFCLFAAADAAAFLGRFRAEAARPRLLVI